MPSGGYVTSASVDPELGSRPSLLVRRHELRQVGAAAEVVADAADHHDLDVVVDGRAAQQVGVAQPRRDVGAFRCSGRLNVIVAILVSGSFS